MRNPKEKTSDWLSVATIYHPVCILSTNQKADKRETMIRVGCFPFWVVSDIDTLIIFGINYIFCLFIIGFFLFLIYKYFNCVIFVYLLIDIYHLIKMLTWHFTIHLSYYYTTTPQFPLNIQYQVNKLSKNYTIK